MDQHQQHQKEEAGQEGIITMRTADIALKIQSIKARI
jgi:hypothetical protein